MPLVLFLMLLLIFRENALCKILTKDIVNLSDGAVFGTEEVTTNKRMSFWVFFGIPYAAPPINGLRFKAPQPVKPWTDIRNATYQRNMCMQPNGDDISEDCLYVNVYTTVRSGKGAYLLPVMVYIHGGAFYFGSGNFGVHGVDLLLEQDVVVVTFNYRLGVFGFLCTMDDASPGNYGLKDQIAALKWVQKNIETFGGDRKKVTIFGHSAGSASILYLMQSNLCKGLFQAAIAQSGSTLNPWAPVQNARLLAFRVGLKNFILTLNSFDLVNRLRKVNAETLVKTSVGPTLELKDNKNGLPWSACLENKRPDAVLTTYSYPLLSSGKFYRVPLMTGFASMEARDSHRLQWLMPLYSSEFEMFISPFVPKDMNAVDRDSAGSKIKQFYFKHKKIQNNTNFVRYASHNLFVRGINKHVGLMSQYIPVYYYRFGFSGGAVHRNFVPEGASHGEELQFLFNVNQTNEEAKLMQSRMLKLWTNFVKYHNPTFQELNKSPDLGKLVWFTADSANEKLTYLNIDSDFSIEENPEKESMQFWDELYNRYGFQPYNSY